MTQTGTEKSRLSRERAKQGLVRIDVWVPRDKLEACKDAIDQITAPDTISRETAQKVYAKMFQVSRDQKLVGAIDQIVKGETND